MSIARNAQEAQQRALYGESSIFVKFSDGSPHQLLSESEISRTSGACVVKRRTTPSVREIVLPRSYPALRTFGKQGVPLPFAKSAVAMSDPWYY